ncbi:MAG TPA: hypothetical protein DEA75_02280 [Rhodobacteraceae bacterium]|nr:hypothetical protein [Paracoccaceae bacterium]
MPLYHNATTNFIMSIDVILSGIRKDAALSVAPLGGAAIFSNFVGVLSEFFLGLNLFTLDPVMGQNICDIAQQDRPRQFQVAKTYNCRSPAGQRNACSRSYGQHLPPNARRQCDQRLMPVVHIGAMASRANMIAMLSTRAERNQTKTLANVDPCLVNIAAVTSAW